MYQGPWKVHMKKQTLLRDKESNKWRVIPYFWLEKLKIINMLMLPKLIYELKVIAKKQSKT